MDAQILLNYIAKIENRNFTGWEKNEISAYLKAAKSVEDFVKKNNTKSQVRRSSEKPIIIGLLLDKRRAQKRKKDNRSPVILRVYHKRNSKRYTLKNHLTQRYFFPDEFDKVMKSKENNKTKNTLLNIELLASEQASRIHPFSFEQFEKAMGFKHIKGH